LIQPHYAVKCNNDNYLIKHLANNKVNFDCASRGEIKQVLDLGINSDRIIYANPYKNPSDVKYASKKWLLTLDIDLSVSLDEIILWKKNNYVTNECNVYFGSRLIKGSKVKKNIIRNLFGILFRFIVY
jgi:diaminopimelate decarboxylase